MKKLIVEKSIEINTTASKVWEVLTNPALSKQWIEQFWQGFGSLESDWKTGSTMEWKTAEGKIDMQGKIISIEPRKMIRYTFTMPKDIVTLWLDERNEHTVLSVTHGDFTDKPDGEECFYGAAAGWEMNLPKIKELAENLKASTVHKLFVDKTIEINAPITKVWDTLTKREFTDQWALEFSSGGPQFYIESEWKPGSPVLWKGQDGTVIVEGNVTALEQNKLLRFTVFDVRSAERPPVTEEDGITFQLFEEKGKTTLHILQGDFSVMTDGEKYRNLSADIWDKVLPKVKELAENDN
ncbi:MAG: SRPBCC family protein [Bacillota bacterium]